MSFEGIKTRVCDFFTPYRHCPVCSSENKYSYKQCWKCDAALGPLQFHPLDMKHGREVVVKIKVCLNCKERNNPTFSKCWKCSSDLSLVKATELIAREETASEIVKGMAPFMLFFLVLCYLPRLVPYSPLLIGTLWFVGVGWVVITNKFLNSPARELHRGLLLLGILLMYFLFLLFCLAGMGKGFFVLFGLNS